MSDAHGRVESCRGAPSTPAKPGSLLTEVQHWLDRPVDAGDEAVLVATVDANGFSRIAQLSRCEIVLSDSNEIALATWVASSTAANLWVNRSCLLYCFVSDSWYSLQVELHSKAAIYPDEGTELTVFRGCVVETRQDSVPYAKSTTGVGFELRDPEPTLALWSRVRAELHRVLRGANA